MFETLEEMLYSAVDDYAVSVQRKDHSLIQELADTALDVTNHLNGYSIPWLTTNTVSETLPSLASDHATVAAIEAALTAGEASK